MNNIKEHINNSMNGFYIGKVENREDTTKSGRLQIRVFNLHSDTLSKEKLPWFIPAFPINASQNNGIGDSNIPELDSIVMVGFINGDISQGFYFATLVGNTGLPNKDDYTQDHRQIKTKTGHLLDIFPEKIIITQDDGSTKISLESGKINILANSSEVNVEGKTITLKDSTNKGNIIINSQKFLTYFKNHIHPTGVGPSGPVMPGSGLETGQDWFTQSLTVD